MIMVDYNCFVEDYNNPNITAHDVRRLHNLNAKQYSRIRAKAVENGDIPPVRHMNQSNAKFYIKTKYGYQVQKTINGKKKIIGNFRDEKTAKKIVKKCIEHNWQINSIQDFIEDNKVKPKNYSLVGGYWVISKTINGVRTVYNIFSENDVDETTIRKIVSFYRSVSWNSSYKNKVLEMVQ